jgi:signal transduction histidine kinase
LVHMGQYEKALYYIKQGEYYLMKTQAKDLASYLFTTKADLALRTGDLANAKLYGDEALQYALKYKNKEAEQFIYILQANYCLKTGDPSTAINYLNKALKTNVDVYPFLAFIAPTYILGFAYYQAGEYAQSEKALRKALGMAEELNVDADKLNALNTLSLIYEKTGRYKEALVQRNAYNVMKDSIQNMEKQTLSNELEVKFRTAQKDKALFQNELLIEKQNRDLDQKNTWLIGAAVAAILLVVMSVVIYLNFKNKNRITALHAKLEGEELERSRIATDLHDGIGGMLAVIKMKLSSGSRAEAQDSDVIELLNETSRQIRNTAHNLMPNVISDFTLKEALTQYVENINLGQQHLKIDLEIHSELNLTKVTTKLSIYRMLQEVVQNIIKHAAATKATIQLFEQPGKLHLLIEDNGMGFDFEKIKKGLGISNLENRVTLMNGMMNIHSSPGRGTIINIEVEV